MSQQQSRSLETYHFPQDMGSTKAVCFQKYLVDSTSKLYQAFAFTEIVIIIVIIIIHQDRSLQS